MFCLINLNINLIYLIFDFMNRIQIVKLLTRLFSIKKTIFHSHIN